MESIENCDNVEKMLDELQQTNKEKHSELVNLLEKCHEKYVNSQKNTINLNALNCFDKSGFAKNNELRKMLDDVQVLEFTKHVNCSDPYVVQNIVVLLGKIRFEIVFHGKMRINEYKGSLNVCIGYENKIISGSANNVSYKIGQQLSFMVLNNANSKPEQSITIVRDNSLFIDNELFNAMNFKLTSKLMFCYFLDFVISDLVKEIVD